MKDIGFTIIRTDGREEPHSSPRATVFKDIAKLLNARTLETVTLKHGRVMFIDEDGYEVELIERPPRDGFMVVIERKAKTALKAANAKATALYRALPGALMTHHIVGDVAIVRDKDFDDEGSEV